MLDLKLVLKELKRDNALIFQPKRAILRITGSDARDFLQRMSTNDLSKLSEESPLSTSFTNNKGRLIDHCLVFALYKNDLLLVSSRANGHFLLDWLKGFHFIEDLELLLDTSGQFALTHVISPSHLAPPITIGSKSMRYCQGLLSDGFSVDFWATIAQPGHIYGGSIEIGDDIWQSLRIAALIPEHPSEINEEWMPQNINLAETIAQDKGCYIGQEVITKAQTFQKNVKTLCGAILSQSSFSLVRYGGHVESVSGEEGVVTSVAPIYLEGVANALVMRGAKSRVASAAYDTLIKSSQSFLIKNTHGYG